MVAVKGKITKVEEVNIEVSHFELENAVICNFNAKEVLELAFEKWKRERGLASDSILSTNSNGTYFWQAYENNGSHYSGYYEIRDKYQPGDEVIWEGFQNLFSKLN